MEERTAKLRNLDPESFAQATPVRFLAAIRELILERIPRDPGGEQFRQGNTLGKENRNWQRAKFHGRYRLFFRYSTQHGAIVYAWISSEDTLRKAGGKSDPYRIFQSMLDKGDPPKDFDALLRKCAELS